MWGEVWQSAWGKGRKVCWGEGREWRKMVQALNYIINKDILICK